MTPPPAPDAAASAADTSPSAAVAAALQRRTGEARPEPRLHATAAALHELGDPQRAFPFIHVTGTNGKTSTARIAESLLRAGGLRTGLFTSPHLVDLAERIALDGAPIPASALAACWAGVEPALERTDSRLATAGEAPLSYFEALTVLAFASFAWAGVECAVIEVGMGGAWDSTNTADGRVAVLTPIALDHTAQLGRTVAEIAHTKSGIIKHGARVVCAPQPPDALREIARTAARQEAGLTVLGADLTVESATTPTGRTLRVGGLRRQLDPLEFTLPLHGEHQAQNAALALAAVELFLADPAVTARGVLDRAEIAVGLAGARSPGRLEQISADPPIYLDVAHNPAGARTLAQALGALLGDAELGVVLGVLDDKDARGMVDALAPLVRHWFVTASSSPRSLPATALAELVRAASPGATISIVEAPDVGVPGVRQVAAATALAQRWAGMVPGRSVVVTGSATVVGDLLAEGAATGSAPAGASAPSDRGARVHA